MKARDRPKVEDVTLALETIQVSAKSIGSHAVLCMATMFFPIILCSRTAKFLVVPPARRVQSRATDK